MAAHVILGPIGWTIGSWVSDIVNAGLTSTFNWLFGAVFGFMYAPLVITGLHHMSNAIDLQLIADFQSTNLWPMIALSNIAQGSAVLAVIFMHRGNKKEEQVATLMGVRATSIGVGGLPGILSIVPQYYLPFLGAMVIAIIVPMGLTYIFRKKGIFNKVDPVDEETGMLYSEEG